MFFLAYGLHRPISCNQNYAAFSFQCIGLCPPLTPNLKLLRSIFSITSLHRHPYLLTGTTDHVRLWPFRHLSTNAVKRSSTLSANSLPFQIPSPSFNFLACHDITCHQVFHKIPSLGIYHRTYFMHVILTFLPYFLNYIQFLLGHPPHNFFGKKSHSPLFLKDIVQDLHPKATTGLIIINHINIKILYGPIIPKRLHFT